MLQCFVTIVSKGAKNLYITPPPFQISPAPISMIWHQRNDRDLGLKWLRKNILSIVEVEVKKLDGNF